MTMSQTVVTRSDRFETLGDHDLQGLWKSVARCVADLPADHWCENYGCRDLAPVLIRLDETAAQRDALLEAAKSAEARLGEYNLNHAADLPGEAFDDASTARLTLVAAIEAAESHQPARQADGPPSSACRGEEPA